TNIMLEIYNHGEHPVVNPMVSVAVYRAPEPDSAPLRQHARRRRQDVTAARAIYHGLDAEPLASHESAPRPKARIVVRGQSSTMANPGVLVDSATFAALREKPAASVLGRAVGPPTMIQALDAAPEGADTL